MAETVEGREPENIADCGMNRVESLESRVESQKCDSESRATL